MMATMLRRDVFTWQIGLDWTGDLVEAMVNIHPSKCETGISNPPPKKKIQTSLAFRQVLTLCCKSRGFFGGGNIFSPFFGERSYGFDFQGGFRYSNGNCWRFPTIFFPPNPELQMCEISPLIFGPGKMSKSGTLFLLAN